MECGIIKKQKKNMQKPKCLDEFESAWVRTTIRPHPRSAKAHPTRLKSQTPLEPESVLPQVEAHHLQQ